MIRTLRNLLLSTLLSSLCLCAATWDEVAAGFGCAAKAHASEQAGGTQYIMEFVPQGQKLGAHERMFTITLVRTSQVDSEANEHVEKAIKSIAGAAERSGAKVIEFSGYRGNYGPTAYFEYVLKGEHNVGVIQRTGPGMIAVQQLATLEGRTPTNADRSALKALLGVK